MSTELRVLFDTEIFGLQAHGGISRYFAALLEHLPAFGVRARLVAPVTFNRHVGPTTSGFVGVSLPHRLGGRVQARLVRHTLPLVDRLTEELASYDVLHRTLYRRRHRTHRPIVATVHDMIPELFPSHFTEDPHEGKRAAVRGAPLVFCNSATTKTDLVRLFDVPSDAVVVTPLGVDHATFRGPRETEDGTLLFVGSRGAYKDFETFARAAARVLRADSGTRVLCVGGGPWKPGELMPFQEAGVAGRVALTTLDDAALARSYRRASLFVFPSRYEGFGLPILEAFAAGCPALLARASCFPEVADDAAAYFEPGDADDLAQEMSRLIRDRPAREELRRRGLSRVTDFTWRRTASLTAAGYRRLLEQTARASA